MTSDARRAAGVLALAFAVGAAALAVEVTWQRWLRLLFGATAPAAAATLCAFFAGQALGAWGAARWMARVQRPLWVAGMLMLGAAAMARTVPVMLRALEPLHAAVYDASGDQPLLLWALRFAIAALATLPASLLFGALLPVLASAWLSRADELSARGTALYGINLLGGAAGAALAAFVLPEWLGVRGTFHAALWWLFAAGIAALVWGARVPARALDSGVEQVVARAPESGVEEAAARAPRRLVALAAFSGFASFALQVVAVRALALVLDQSVYAFGALLVVVHVALAAASLGVRALLLRAGIAPGALAAWACAAAGLATAALPTLLYGASDGLSFQAAPAGSRALISALQLAFFVAGPALLAAGGLLPAVIAAAGADPTPGAASGTVPAALLGRLLAANTLGAVAGALFAPFVLLAWLSPFAACAAVAVAYAVVALFVPMPSRELRLARDTVLGLGWVILLTAANPLSLPLVRLAPGEELRHVESGPGGVVAVVARGEDLVLRTDNHQSLAGSADRVHQERQGWVAHLLHPMARRVAWIGSATGISAGPFTVARLDELVLIEITPGVSRSAAEYFARWNRGVHQHHATRIVQDDARNFLRATSSRFDLIVADLFVPWIAGTGSLYTREHFQAVRAHLNEGGLFVQWLPLYQLDEASFLSIVATFTDEFPCSALFRGDFFGRFPIVALVGCVGKPPDYRTVARAVAAKGDMTAPDTDRWIAHPHAFFALYAGPLGPLRPALKDVPRNTDDEPVVELSAARSGIGTDTGISAAYTGSRLVTFVSALREAATREGDDFFPNLPEKPAKASEAGELLQAASTAFGAGNTTAASALLRSASERLPHSVLDPERPDPTSAEVWPNAPGDD